MVIVQAPQLEAFITQMFVAVGVPFEEAGVCGRIMVGSNVCGHPSHGVRQTGRYLGLIRQGLITPGRGMEVERETPAMARLNANRSLGHVAAWRAIDIALKKAKKLGLAAVSVRNLNHVGRVGAYAERMVDEGMAGLLFVNSQTPQVAPFGGAEVRYGTNPISAGLPNPSGDPIILDFATSAVAANKVHQASTHQQPTGLGWIALNNSGEPTTNAESFKQKEAFLLPLGGAQGHKGYALGVLVDILCGILGGSGAAHRLGATLDNGMFMVCIDPWAFVDKAEYIQELGMLSAHIQSAKPLPNGAGVSMPGAYEAENRRKNLKQGVEIEPPIWEMLCNEAKVLDVALPTAKTA